VDALALSLSCEYLARAASEEPGLFRSLALVSPTGFNRARPFDGPPGSTRGKAWLYKLLTSRLLGEGLFRQLTRPSVIRYFLQRTWGRKEIDETLWAYCCKTVREPGAANAPFYFLSAFLFSADISTIYQSLTLPVWLSHGVRGDFTDYRYTRAVETKPNWRVQIFSTGALPFFEVPDEFARGYAQFLGAYFGTR
jgi:pimeloyl-ACP methyl ester carboxylesterase